MLVFEYTFEGLIPSKKNSKTIRCYGRPCLFPSKAFKSWHELQQYPMKLAREDQGITEPIKETKFIRLSFTSGTMRKWDLTNKAESVMDFLVDMKIIEDDNVFVCPEVILSFKGVEKGVNECRVEIVV